MVNCIITKDSKYLCLNKKENIIKVEFHQVTVKDIKLALISEFFEKKHATMDLFLYYD